MTEEPEITAAIYKCTDWRPDAGPLDCHKYVTAPVAFADGYGNPFCPPCARRRFATARFLRQPVRLECDGFSASGSGGPLSKTEAVQLATDELVGDAYTDQDTYGGEPGKPESWSPPPRRLLDPPTPLNPETI